MSRKEVHKEIEKSINLLLPQRAV